MPIRLGHPDPIRDPIDGTPPETGGRPARTSQLRATSEVTSPATVTSVVVVGATLVAVPGGAVLGVRQKFDRYPDLPSCTAGFRAGPALPVVRAAQAGFAELDHPGPFSGGGSSGVDGCSSQLMVDARVDVPAVYRQTLIEAGWRIGHDEPARDFGPDAQHEHSIARRQLWQRDSTRLNITRIV